VCERREKIIIIDECAASYIVGKERDVLFFFFLNFILYIFREIHSHGVVVV
jgi:hypothetical protein